MNRSRWGGAIRIAILANYVSLLTIGQSLHNHGVATTAAPPRLVCAHGCSCSHAADDSAYSRARSPERQKQLGWSAGEAAVPDDQPCLICRFLSQKPAPFSSREAVVSSSFVSRVAILKPSGFPLPPWQALRVRGPPAVI
jgi:hypothetical protein